MQLLFPTWDTCFWHQSHHMIVLNTRIMGLLPDTENCRLRMRREYREHFSRRPFQRKPLVSDPGVHHGTCVTHVPWCMSGSLTCGDGENVPGIPGACAPAILCIWQEDHCVAMQHCQSDVEWLADHIALLNNFPITSTLHMSSPLVRYQGCF